MTKTTLSYLLLFFILLIASGLKANLPDRPPPIKFSLPAVVENDVQKIVITKGKEHITIERDTAQSVLWNITEPIKFLADQETVHSLLEGFSSPISMDLKMTEDPKEFDFYELTEEKALKISFFKKDSSTVDVLIGKPTSGGSSFIMDTSEKIVYRAKVAGKTLFEKTVNDWRERRLLLIPADAVSKIKIISDKNTFSFVKNNGIWSHDPPVPFELDAMRLESLVSDATLLRAKTFVDTVGDNNEYADAFASPIVSIELTIGTNSFNILIGKEKSQDEYYASRLGDKQIYTISAEQLKQFQLTLADFRDKRVIQSRTEDLIEVIAHHGKNRVVLKREEAGWKIAESTVKNLNPNMPQAVLSSVSMLRAIQFESVDLKSTGLETDPLEVVATNRSGQKFGVKVGNKKNDTETYAVRSHEKDVFIVKSFGIESFRYLLGEVPPEGSTPKPTKNMRFPNKF